MRTIKLIWGMEGKEIARYVVMFLLVVSPIRAYRYFGYTYGVIVQGILAGVIVVAIILIIAQAAAKIHRFRQAVREAEAMGPDHPDYRAAIVNTIWEDEAGYFVIPDPNKPEERIRL